MYQKYKFLVYNIQYISQNQQKEDKMEDYSFINVSQEKLETINILKAAKRSRYTRLSKNWTN